MRKLLIFILIIVAAGLWFKQFVRSGGFDRYLDAHPNQALNPAVEYYWGMTLGLADRKESAAYRFTRVTEKYPKSDYAALAYIEYIETLDNMGDRARTIEECKKFLESDYANHPKAEIIRKKLKFFEQGM